MTGINANDDYNKITSCILILWIIIKVLTKPAIKSPVSSFIPSEIAALNPMIDHIAGMIITIKGILDEQNNSMPEVKIVAGQGSPKVDDEG
ncbi:MAG TPA: hypothetical protein VFU29_18100 [Chitinophagaceae bacterium]|nr:hypothetical protein [Chitinophagaceae bacterium]